MDTPIDLQIADGLVRQARLNDAIIETLAAVRDALEAVSDEGDDQREAIGSVAGEVARLNQRVESLTATVGRLMLLIEPLEPELHSVKT